MDAAKKKRRRKKGKRTRPENTTAPKPKASEHAAPDVAPRGDAAPWNGNNRTKRKDVPPSQKREPGTASRRGKRRKRSAGSSCAGTTTTEVDGAALEEGAAGISKKKKPPSPSPIGRKSSSASDAAGPSLASRLKRERGTAASTPLPPEWISGGSAAAASAPSSSSVGGGERVGSRRFLTPNDDEFEGCVARCYKGFYWEGPDDLPRAVHSSFSEGFRGLNDAGLFLYDVVQPGGRRLSRTFVTRTLIGEPGSTYRYLGLRLFSHPWCMVTARGDRAEGEIEGRGGAISLNALGYDPECAAALSRIEIINRRLAERTESLLKDKVAPSIPGGLVGSARYNLTLINRMEPTSTKRDLKREKLFGMGKTSVSWHKDSGLQDFSSIAVYHSLEAVERGGGKRAREKKDPWRVALRVAADVPTPALSVPLPSGSLYYLCDDFNHKHEHAVLSGSDELRYSSTHRVAREGQGTWQYIRDKCDAVLAATCFISDQAKIAQCSTTMQHRQLVKEVRSHQNLMTEIEFEWLRMWHVQGKKHADLHPYWHRPMEKLISVFKLLEEYSVSCLKLLEKSSVGLVPAACEELFDVMIEALGERMQQRSLWQERLADPIFQSMPADEEPMECSALDREQPALACEVPEDLKELGSSLRQWRAKFLALKEGQSGNVGLRATDRKGSLTKKEQKKVASNWERMKLKIGKAK